LDEIITAVATGEDGSVTICVMGLAVTAVKLCVAA
jgi:hypothetical protein